MRWRADRNEQWRRWFAWYPVLVYEGDHLMWVVGEWVERRECRSDDEGVGREWVARLIEPSQAG